MPRIIRTTWFADLGYYNVPIFDFKLAKLTPRQLLMLLVCTMLAYASVKVLFLFTHDTLYVLFGAVGVFAVCAALLVRKGRVFSPEWYVLHFLRRVLRGPRLPKLPARRAGAKGAAGEAARPMVAPLGEPTRIAGVLFDPSTGRRLADAAFVAEVDGRPYDSGRTDRDGAYSLVFTPPGPGVYNLTVRLKDSKTVLESIRVVARAPGERVVLPPERGKVAVAKEAAKEEMAKEEAAAEGRGGEKEKVEEYIYELFPTNFVSLPDQEQDRIVNSFRSFLNSLESPARIIIMRSAKTVTAAGRELTTEYLRFFAASDQPIDAQLEAAGISFQRTTEVPYPSLVHVTKSFVAVEGGRTLRTATITELPQTLVEGFLCELYGLVDRVVISVQPLEQGEAAAKLEKHYRIKLGFAYTGRVQQQEVAEGQMAQEALQRLVRGESRLFRVVVNLAVGGSTAEELADRMRRLRSLCRGRLVHVDSPMFVQREMVRGDLGKVLYMDTVTLGAFFPFVSADMIETPGGVCLGENKLTGAPVVFDPYLRMNQNIAIIGLSGSGKSMSAKILLTRLLERHPDLAYFIIDPEDEYAKAMGRGAQKVAVERSRKLGLDPFLLFPDAKDIVLEILADLLGASGDQDLYSELQVAVQASGSLQELRKRVGRKLRGRLDGLLRGPNGFLFSGKPEPLSDRVVFSFKELHQAVRAGGERGALHLASLLVFGKIWKRIEELPKERLKVVIVDEVWLYTGMPIAASFLESVARRGRKRNVLLALCSQRPADVFASEKGRAVLENCATKLLFNQDQASASLLKQAFELTDYEVEQCTNFREGDAILLARGIRISLHFLCTPEEYARFTTRATEV